MKDIRTLTEGAILAAVFAILLLVTAYVPLVGMITLWALPLPFVIYVLRRGLKAGFMLVAVASFLAFLVGGLPSIPAALVFGSAGLVVGELYRREQPGLTVLIGAGLTYTINMLLVFLGLVFLLGENPMQMAADLTREQIEFAESAFDMPAESVAQMNEMLNQLGYLAPLMIVGAGVFCALITLLISRLVLRRLGHEVNGLPPFREWQFPKSFLWYYLIVLILAMGGFEQGTTMYAIVWNLFPLLEIILAVQGFGFIFFFCHHRGISKAVPILLVISAIIMSPLLFIIRILGIIDLGFDLRKRVISQKK